MIASWCGESNDIWINWIRSDLHKLLVNRPRKSQHVKIHLFSHFTNDVWLLRKISIWRSRDTVEKEEQSSGASLVFGVVLSPFSSSSKMEASKCANKRVCTESISEAGGSLNRIIDNLIVLNFYSSRLFVVLSKSEWSAELNLIKLLKAMHLPLWTVY